MNALKKNHFELFSLKPAFALDRRELDDVYRRVMSAVHPDRFTGTGASEQRLAQQLAAQANEAYRTLAEPVSRGRYLCEINGVDPQIESNTAMPADFLMRQLDWRERLEEATQTRDRGALDELTGELAALRDEITAMLATALDTAHDYQGAADLVRQLLFVDRFATELERVEESLAALA